MINKSELMERTKKVQDAAAALVERAGALRTDVSNLLQAAKRHESALIARENRLESERIEKEKADRLRDYLESQDDQHGVYVSDFEENKRQEAEKLAREAEETAAREAAEKAAREAAEKEAAEKAAEKAAREAAARETAARETEAAEKAAREAADRGAAARPAQADRNRQGDTRQPGRQDAGPRQRGDKPERGDRPQRTGERIGADQNRDQRRPRDDNRRPGQDTGRPQRGTDRAQTAGDKDRDDAQKARTQTRPAARHTGGEAPIVQKEQRTPDKSHAHTFDTEKKAKSKKTIMKENGPSAKNWEDDGAAYGSRKKKNQKQAEPQRRPEPVVIDKAVITTETITVREFSEKIGKPAAEIIKKLFMMGIIANINQDIDFDTCELIAMDYNIELEHQVAETYEEAMQKVAEIPDTEADLKPRPPVVTIMGHVDHGKTSLLDAIRKSSITEGEAGGITQHIGAYTVDCNGRMITFIDTPGHEAFTSMRARGAQVTDVVILVVAADDGIMPQTIEAINHSKAANVPIVVAINKIDKPTANPDKVKQQLLEYGLVSEEWGGDTICVPVSAKKRMNLDNLLEMVLLQAEVLELRANPNRPAKGTIIEAQLDKGRGPVATVLVQNGTLKVGDPIVAGVAYGRVRAMMDDKGRSVKAAGPSQPVEVLGFNEVPSAGDVMNVAEVSKKVAEERKNKIKADQIKAREKVSLEDLFSHIAEGEIKTLNIVIKADVHGSVEAVKQALEKLSNEEVRVKCIHGAVGAISESDVMFASASNAIVIGFNVRPDSGARALAETEKVDIRTYRVIYQAIEDVENAMKG